MKYGDISAGLSGKAALRTPITFFSSTECFPVTGPEYPIFTIQKKSYLIPNFYQTGLVVFLKSRFSLRNRQEIRQNARNPAKTRSFSNIS